MDAAGRRSAALPPGPPLELGQGALEGARAERDPGGDVLHRVTRFAGQAARASGCGPGTTVQLINVSENATYLVQDPGRGPSILRVHRLGYHATAEIESELAWMDACGPKPACAPRGCGRPPGARGS